MVPITIVELESGTIICINGTLWDYRVTDPDLHAIVISGICLALERDPTDLYNSAALFIVFFCTKNPNPVKREELGPGPRNEDRVSKCNYFFLPVISNSGHDVFLPAAT